ncbi:hypothetical protein [Hwangdonia lutea]|uniref:Uracil-DNA glycosylase-like domain-containing protein n=1 Tax=Hwangdonia lutea TaxID=3075823 RepID=A0AA97EMK5_9FLAO|nr:hypothetical protein [Hwangdonia sp. SCSIO 19198]WOD44186.1 hypothetical protein RNZ46_02730 [Hwangdonia sp. SCSIO 19198]
MFIGVMGVRHKFFHKDFGEGFRTENAILIETPYKPEILFIGTFNPLTNDEANPADFFYGRNWFWPILFNIFKHNKIAVIEKQRKFYPPDFNPTLKEVFGFMKKHKLSFADLIMEILPEKNINCIAGNNIFYENEHYDLIKDNHLAKLNRKGEVSWSTKHLIDYINYNPQIKQVYFTRKSTSPFSEELYGLEKVLSERHVKVKQLFTPSGQGLKGTPRNRILMDQWLQSTKLGFNSLDTKWTNF